MFKKASPILGSSEWHGRSTKYPAVPPFFLCSWAWELQDGWSFAIFNMQLQELIELKNSTLSYKHSSQMGFRNESKNLCILEYWLFSHFGLESLMSTSETTPQQYFFLKKKKKTISNSLIYFCSPKTRIQSQQNPPKEINHWESKKLRFTKN